MSYMWHIRYLAAALHEEGVDALARLGLDAGMSYMCYIRALNVVYVLY